MTNIKLEIACKDKNVFTIVDPEFEYLQSRNLLLDKDGYVQFSFESKPRKLHRFVMDAKKGDIVDHINGDKLDNRTTNLRFVTHQQNSHNKKKRGKTSKYRGVSKSGTRWISSCGQYYLGIFTNELHAAYAYNLKAKELYKEVAILNDIHIPDDYVPYKNPEYKFPPGVEEHRPGQFQAYMHHNNKKIYLGSFKTIEEADQAAQKGRETLELKKQKEHLDQPIKRNRDGVAIIVTSRGDEFLVDDDTWYELSKFSWSNRKGYALGRINSRKVSMHRHICNCTDKNMIVDHINGNKFDNRRSNLRICTPGQNNQNKRVPNSTGYIGITKRYTGKYVAQISYMGKKLGLGTYLTAEEATVEYDRKALELYGPHAKTNGMYPCVEPFEIIFLD